MNATLTLKLNKEQFKAFLISLSRAQVELIRDRDKAELVKPFIVDLSLRLMKRYDNIKPADNLVKLNRLEMVAYRAIMTVCIDLYDPYYRVIIMDTLSAIDHKEIYTINKFEKRELSSSNS